MSETLNQIRFRIDGMDCASCAAKIETAVRRVRGIKDVSVSVAGGTMTVSHDGTGDLDKIAAKVRSLGYGAEPVASEKAPAKGEHSHDHSHHDHDHDHDHGRAAAATIMRMIMGMSTIRTATARLRQRRTVCAFGSMAWIAHPARPRSIPPCAACPA